MLLATLFLVGVVQAALVHVAVEEQGPVGAVVERDSPPKREAERNGFTHVLGALEPLDRGLGGLLEPLEPLGRGLGGLFSGVGGFLGDIAKGVGQAAQGTHGLFGGLPVHERVAADWNMVLEAALKTVHTLSAEDQHALGKAAALVADALAPLMEKDMRPALSDPDYLHKKLFEPEPRAELQPLGGRERAQLYGYWERLLKAALALLPALSEADGGHLGEAIGRITEDLGPLLAGPGDESAPPEAPTPSDGGTGEGEPARSPARPSPARRPSSANTPGKLWQDDSFAKLWQDVDDQPVFKRSPRTDEASPSQSEHSSPPARSNSFSKLWKDVDDQPIFKRSPRTDEVSPSQSEHSSPSGGYGSESMWKDVLGNPPAEATIFKRSPRIDEVSPSGDDGSMWKSASPPAQKSERFSPQSERFSPFGDDTYVPASVPREPEREPAAANPFGESPGNPFDEPSSGNPFDEPAAAGDTFDKPAPAGNPFGELQSEDSPGVQDPVDSPRALDLVHHKAVFGARTGAAFQLRTANKQVILTTEYGTEGDLRIRTADGSLVAQLMRPAAAGGDWDLYDADGEALLATVVAPGGGHMQVFVSGRSGTEYASAPASSKSTKAVHLQAPDGREVFRIARAGSKRGLTERFHLLVDAPFSLVHAMAAGLAVAKAPKG